MPGRFCTRVNRREIDMAWDPVAAECLALLRRQDAVRAGLISRSRRPPVAYFTELQGTTDQRLWMCI